MTSLLDLPAFDSSDADCFCVGDKWYKIKQLRNQSHTTSNRRIFMRTLTTRLVTITIVASLLFSGLLTVYGQSSQARIKIDTDRTIGEINPLLFGNFAEHLGRMIYGGIYEEGSSLSDQRCDGCG
jgi:hypothetical protein